MTSASRFHTANSSGLSPSAFACSSASTAGFWLTFRALAWQTVLEVYRAVLDRLDVVPGMIATIHTFGQLVHFHPHIHALVTDGGFAPDGTFIALPELERDAFEKLWQRKVFALHLKHGKITESLVTQMLGWRRRR